LNIESKEPGMDQSELVSIIIAAYNAAQYVGETLESVFAQSYSNYQVIVVNDGSPDTPELEKVLEPFLSRITYLQQENRGIAAARNTGLRAATGRLVAFLDADDIWLPNYLGEQTGFLREHPEIDVVYCNARFFGDSAHDGMEYMDVCPSEGPATAVAIITRRCHVFVSVTARTEVLRTVGFREALRSCEDFDLWLRTAAAGYKIGYHRKILVRYRKHRDSLSANLPAMAEYKIRVFEDALSLWPEGSDERDLIVEAGAQKTAELENLRGKLSLKGGDIPVAVKHFEAANGYYKSSKLSLVVALLRVAPWTVSVVYGMRSFFSRAHRIDM
jgi:glycosyltransferase involved in cell wall biosynthesis